jgi:hypothetical protein
MQQKFFSSQLIIIISIFVGMSSYQWVHISDAQEKTEQQDAVLTIVKYGSVMVKSSIPDAKVFVDGDYKGMAENIVESVVVGEHVISCRVGSRTVSGSFTVKKNEMLRLEARFDEGRLMVTPEVEKVEVEKPEPEKKKKTEPIKYEKPKKRAPVVEVKREEPKDPQEERRKLHLTPMKIFFEITPSQEIRIDHRASQTTISKYMENKTLIGRYYRTKQNVLLCDAGPCEMSWTASFLYTREAGKSDAFLLSWKEIVFNGITPVGTSKRVLEWCLDGVCRKLEDTSAADTEQNLEIEIYKLSWTKTSVTIRRTDIMNEIAAAGKSLSDY